MKKITRILILIVVIGVLIRLIEFTFLQPEQPQFLVPLPTPYKAPTYPTLPYIEAVTPIPTPIQLVPVPTIPDLKID